MPDWKARLNWIKANGYPADNVATVMELPVIVSWEEGHVHNEWEVKKKYFTIGERLFGGYVCALADQIAAHTAMTVLPDDMIVRTVELSTAFFKRITEGKLYLDGRVIAHGNHLIHCDITFHDDTRTLVAKASAVMFKERIEQKERGAGSAS